MKRILSVFLCLLLVCSCAVAACAAETTAPQDATEINTGPAAGNAFFVFALVLALIGAVYLFFKFRK